MSAEVNGELPEGWVETSLAQLLCVLETGSRPRGGVRGITNGVPSIGGEHLDDEGSFRVDNTKYVPKSFFEQMTRGHIQQGDILVVKDGATTGKVSLVRAAFPFAQAVVNEHVFICRSAGDLLPQFVFWFLYSQEGQKRILENFQGSAQGGINQAFAPGTQVPVAPLAEQRRIVAAVEAVLAKVNAARERLSRVPAILKRFRQAVLSAACSGRLTADWRTNQNIVDEPTANDEGLEYPDSWSCKLTKDLVEPGTVISYGIVLPGPNLAEGVQYIRGLDIDDAGQIHVAQLWRTSAEIAAKHKRAEVRQGDVLLCVIRNLRVAIVPSGIDGANLTQGTVRLRPSAEILGPYLAHYLASPHAQEWMKRQYVGSDMPRINVEHTRAIPVPLPPLAEQQEIVRRVDKLFALADVIEARLTDARRMADQLTQAVLAKAFRGELVPTEAALARREKRTYEPASELLARIRAEREQPATPTRQKPARVHSATQPAEPNPARDAKTARLHRALALAYFTDRQPKLNLLNRTRAIKLAAVAQWQFGTALALVPVRAERGPYDKAIEDIEKDAEKAGFIETYKKPKDGDGFAVRYRPGPKSAAACKKARALFGDALPAVDEFLDRMFEMNTDDVELFGTVYAAWNDLLLDNRPADNTAILAEVHGWHASKRDKFPKAAVHAMLTRIREWGYIPKGTTPRTRQATAGEE